MSRPRAENAAEQIELRETFRWMRRLLGINQEALLERLEITQGSLSKWERGEIDFQTAGKLEAVIDLMCEWRDSRPDEFWRNGEKPFVCFDSKEGIYRNLDFRDESPVAAIYRYNLWVICNRVCENRGCARLTPREGQFCMHCGQRQSFVRLPDVDATDKFAWPPASSASRHDSEKSPPKK